ncbi:MAG: 50S ribosomal protein L17 [Candidatus Magasanikbacteria bacterium]|nr:50S ribosomal protein L17 [Candidatus Magasanikbacteria bacterium]
MRHNKKKVTLGREKKPREAMFRNLAQSLILSGNIRTTQAKAKALRGVVERLITKAKKVNGLTARRRIQAVLYTDEAVDKLVKELGLKYKDRQGGYTRVIKLPPRKNDGALMARIELV